MTHRYPPIVSSKSTSESLEPLEGPSKLSLTFTHASTGCRLLQYSVPAHSLGYQVWRWQQKSMTCSMRTCEPSIPVSLHQPTSSWWSFKTTSCPPTTERSQITHPAFSHGRSVAIATELTLCPILAARQCFTLQIVQLSQVAVGKTAYTAVKWQKPGNSSAASK